MKYDLKYDRSLEKSKEYQQQISWQLQMIDMAQQRYQTMRYQLLELALLSISSKPTSYSADDVSK